MKKSCLLFLVLAVFILGFPHQGFSQQSTTTKTYTMPPQLQQAVNKGLVSPQQAQAWMEALEKGQITVETINEALKPFEAKGGLGTLTREEIEMGKKLLDEKI